MPTIRTYADLVSWIDNCVLGDLRTLLKGVDEYYRLGEDRRAAEHLGAANFLLVAGCCSAIDYLGKVGCAKGNDESRALAFISDHLAKVDPRYDRVGRCIWTSVRHGTVHRSWPTRLEAPGAPPIILAVGGESIDPHLRAEVRATDVVFYLNGRLFLADLERACREHFFPWLEMHLAEDLLERARPQRVNAKGNTLLLNELDTIRSWASSTPA